MLHGEHVRDEPRTQRAERALLRERVGVRVARVRDRAQHRRREERADQRAHERVAAAPRDPRAARRRADERDDAAELAPVAGGGGVVVARADCVEQNAGDDGLRGAASAWPLHRVLHQKETDPYLRYVAHPTTKENHHRHPRCDQNASDEHSARRGERVAVTSIHRHGRRIRAWHTLPPS